MNDNQNKNSYNDDKYRGNKANNDNDNEMSGNYSWRFASTGKW